MARISNTMFAIFPFETPGNLGVDVERIDSFAELSQDLEAAAKPRTSSSIAYLGGRDVQEGKTICDLLGLATSSSRPGFSVLMEVDISGNEFLSPWPACYESGSSVVDDLQFLIPVLTNTQIS